MRFKGLGYVAQEPDLGTGSARQAIAHPFTYKANIGARGNLGRLPTLLERFNLPPDILEKPMSTLSGGEKQRIALLSALLLERPILLLDEASSALDHVNQQLIVAFLRQSPELTVLSVAHDPEWLNVSSRVVDLSESARPTGTQA